MVISTVNWSRNDKRGRCWWTVARGVCFLVCELETESDIPCTGLLTSWYSSNLLGSGEIKLKMNSVKTGIRAQTITSVDLSLTWTFFTRQLYSEIWKALQRTNLWPPLRPKNVCMIHYSSQSVNNVFNRHSYSSKVDFSLSFLCFE